MSSVILWTTNALTNLEQIYSFLSEKSELAAISAIKSIREKALLLEKFPYAGRPAEDLEPEQRELLIPFGESGYVMLYKAIDSRIYILAIRHQREIHYKANKK